MDNDTATTDTGDSGFVGSDGTFNEGWTNGEAFKENADTLSRFGNVTDMANSYMELRKKSSKNPDSMIEVPSENSSDEVKDAWTKAHNVPDAYEYQMSDEMATKIGPISDIRMDALKEFGKGKNWSQQDFVDVLDFYHNNVSSDIDAGETAMNESNQQRYEAGVEMLKGQWLEGTDDRTAAALAHLQRYGEFDVKGKDGETINPLEKLFEESPQLKQSPWLTMIMDNMASKMGESGRVGGKDSSALSIDGINSQIADIRGQQAAIRDANPVNFKSNPQFKELESRLIAMYQKKPA